MNRRIILKTISLAAGVSLVGPAALFSSCQSEGYIPKFFQKKDMLLLNEIGETILPATKDTPGAKAVNVANFIDVYVADCYSLENQKIIQKGLTSFQKNAKEKSGTAFLKMTPEKRHDYLVELDQLANKSPSTHYFSLLKNLVLLGYFTSKEGAEKGLRYVPVPGKYEGNYPFKKGDKAWALG